MDALFHESRKSKPFLIDVFSLQSVPSENILIFYLKWVSLADALKAATSDGIKKTATLFGVALEDDDVSPPKPYVQQNQRGNPS